jgi:hypothetical protein
LFWGGRARAVELEVAAGAILADENLLLNPDPIPVIADRVRAESSSCFGNWRPEGNWPALTGLTLSPNNCLSRPDPQISFSVHPFLSSCSSFSVVGLRVSFLIWVRRTVLFVLGISGACLVTACGGGGSSSQTSPQQPFAIAVSPAVQTIYAGQTFSVTVTATGNRSNLMPSVTPGSLPAGLTSTTTFPLSIPAGGAKITFVAGNSLAAGVYAISLKATAGTATVAAGQPPIFSFHNPSAPLLSEVVVPIGGSAQIRFDSESDNTPAYYSVQLSVSGLPTGVKATVSPESITPGESVTVNLSASSDAPITQNATLTLTGTASVAVPSANVSFLADITPKPGGLPVNRTDYTSTEGSPASAVYDPAQT